VYEDDHENFDIDDIVNLLRDIKHSDPHPDQLVSQDAFQPFSEDSLSADIARLARRNSPRRRAVYHGRDEHGNFDRDGFLPTYGRPSRARQVILAQDDDDSITPWLK